MTPERFFAALEMDAYLESTRRNTEFWRGVWRTARLDEGAIARAHAIATPLHLLALSEDWCGDAVNTLPVIARLVSDTPAVDLRILGRDANPDLMDAHLTRGTRSIPVVIAYDDGFTERGWWGPRPRELQQLFLGEWQSLEKPDRTRNVRTWYARDRGRTTVSEILDLMESTSAGVSHAPVRGG